MKRPLFLFLLLAACEPVDVSPGTAAYGSGNLGNGGFAFTCDDSVVCGDFDAAEKFPDAVALGSKFTVRYLPKSGTTTTVRLEGVGSTLLSNLGAGYFTAIGEGIATIAAKDSGGTLIEFVELPVRRPDAIVISRSGSNASVNEATLFDGYGAEYRASARFESAELAGTLSYEWTSDSDVVDVQGRTEGRVWIAPRKPGHATLTVTGGALTQSIEVEVQ